MKKVLKAIGVLLLLIIAFFLIAGLFVKKDYHFEKSIVINAPKEIIWQNVSRFGNFEKWNPYASYDPDMKSNIEGTDGTVGAVYKWKGNKDVGSGSQTITRLEPMQRVEIQLHFKTPFGEMKPEGYYTIQDDNTAQKVTWGFNSHSPYPFNALSIFFNMDKMMDKDFTQGLNNLKQLCESGMPAAQQPE
jgi:hypothetical protein